MDSLSRELGRVSRGGLDGKWMECGRINTEDVLIGSQFQLSLVEERLLPMVKLVYRIRPEEDKNTQLELS